MLVNLCELEKKMGISNGFLKRKLIKKVIPETLYTKKYNLHSIKYYFDYEITRKWILDNITKIGIRKTPKLIKLLNIKN